FLTQDLLGAMIGGGDEVAGAFQRNLQTLHLAEITLEPARGLAGGLHHHVEEGGPKHQERGSCSASSHALAAFSPASRSPGLRPCMYASSDGSPSPAALARRCHLVASAGSAGMLRPLARMCAS